MTLKSESVQLLADTIAPQVFEVLSTDGRYLDGVMNSIEPAIQEVLGRVSPDLVGELGCLIVEKIGVIENNDPYAEFNIWKTRYEALYRYVKKNYAESYVDGAEYDIQHPNHVYPD